MITIKENAEVGRLTTFNVGARASLLVEYGKPSELIQYLEHTDVPRPVMVMGGGSNLLFAADFCGTVIRQRQQPALVFVDEEGYPGCIRAFGNVVLDELCEYAAEQGLRGLENLSGIPGTVGGALVQNAGAYGVEIGSLVESIQLINLQTLEFEKVGPEWMQYSYRSSMLKQKSGQYAIVQARLRLADPSAPAKLDHGGLSRVITNPQASPMEVRQAVLNIRRAKLPDPKDVGSAGSFFRNPEVAADKLLPDMPRYEVGPGLYKVPAAWLIDQCGLKGRQIGGAKVWPSQPLVIVNAEGRATAADIIALKDLIIAEVKQKFDITLTPEVEIIF